MTDAAKSQAVRRLCLVTSSRADYSYYRPILQCAAALPDLHLELLVTGTHLSPVFGSTVAAIENDGFEIAERIDMHIDGDTPAAIAASMGRCTSGMAAALDRRRPDIVIVIGDRFEMLAATAAALPFVVPVAHIGGGELTEGAIDESARHAITKLSHLHFVQTDIAGRRVVQMGEEPWRVVVVGAVSLDALADLKPLDRSELERRFGLSLAVPPLLVTMHPVTLDYANADRDAEALIDALAAARLPVIFTAPNADTSHGALDRAIQQYLATHPEARLVPTLGAEAFFSLLPHVRAMVGNSSSGIIEAASFELPVVNIGDRQAGRLHGPNVLDVTCDRRAITDAIQRAVSEDFRSALRGLRNPYFIGHAAARIVAALRSVELGPRLTTKRFHHIAPSEVPA